MPRSGREVQHRRWDREPHSRRCGRRLNRAEISEIGLCGCLGLPSFPSGGGLRLGRIAIDRHGGCVGEGWSRETSKSARRCCGRVCGATQHRSRSRDCACTSTAVRPSRVAAGRLSNCRSSIGYASSRDGIASQGIIKTGPNCRSACRIGSCVRSTAIGSCRVGLCLRGARLKKIGISAYCIGSKIIG